MKIFIKDIVLSPKATLSLLGGVFLFSLLLFLVWGPEKKRVILFFPEDDLVSVSGDHHILPRKESREENMQVLLAEALLEPFDYLLNETVPEGVRLNSFIYDKEQDILYVDLSLEMISFEDQNFQSVEGDRMLEILEKNLRFNFRRLEEVKFTIDGQVPHSYVFNESLI
ncbi:MAG: GerMN domain-containing protein [Spirochaetales bacterium]|nr:GerMN domain-containing protein [Spirochaetales bacterium]